MGRTNVEYATDQITVYDSCPFGCKYCWACTPLMQYRIRNPKPLYEAFRYARIIKERRIVISFTSDPYQPREARECKTREALEILCPTRHQIMILTKECLVARDYPLLRKFPNVMVGMTITALQAVPDEPYASPNDQRITCLEKAKSAGIKTWVSMEPVIPGVTNHAKIIKETHEFVDFYVLGKMDYEAQFGYPKLSPSEYFDMVNEALNLLRSYNKKWHIKKQLGKYMELLERGGTLRR